MLPFCHIGTDQLFAFQGDVYAKVDETSAKKIAIIASSGGVLRLPTPPDRTGFQDHWMVTPIILPSLVV